MPRHVIYYQVVLKWILNEVQSLCAVGDSFSLDESFLINTEVTGTAKYATSLLVWLLSCDPHYCYSHITVTLNNGRCKFLCEKRTLHFPRRNFVVSFAEKYLPSRRTTLGPYFRNFSNYREHTPGSHITDDISFQTHRNPQLKPRRADPI